jgi:drug/metabolite transporter (DMT)-like permease
MKGQWRAEAALAVVALVWGSTFVVIKQALADVSPLLFIALRFTLGTAALWAVFRTRTSGVPDLRAEWRGGILTGLLLFAGYAFQTVGLTLTTPSKSAFLTGLYIVLVPLLSAAVYRKEPHPSEWLGVLMASAGVAILTVPGVEFRINWGDVLTVGCAVAFAGQILVLERYAHRGRSERLAMIQLGTVAVAAAASFRWTEKPFVVWSGNVIFALLLTGLFATAAAFAVQAWAQARTTATRAALIFALEPAFAAVTSVVAGAETVTGVLIAGCGLILAGIGVVELKPLRFGEHPSK